MLLILLQNSFLTLKTTFHLNLFIIFFELNFDIPDDSKRITFDISFTVFLIHLHSSREWIWDKRREENC